MKRFSITVSFCILGFWLLLPDKRAEENQTSHRSTTPISSTGESSPFSVDANEAPQVRTNKQQIEVHIDTSTEILRGLPKALKPHAVIGFDIVANRADGMIRRAIVSTDTALGKIFLIEHLDGNQVVRQEIYSAEHLVVSLKKNGNENDIDLAIERSGFAFTKPFLESDFLFAQMEVESPKALLSKLDSLSDKLQGLAVVELDGAGSGGATPSDPSYSSQWHHQSIHSESSWDITKGNSSIVVAVLDTGINEELSEFEGRIVSGYDYANDDSDPADDNGHGTEVAAVTMANANNGVLVSGVDWNCKVMPVKVLDSSNWGYYSWWAAGINYARNNGARVINLSAGGTGSSSTLTSAINNAISEGVIFVTISHNDGTETIRYPGSLPQAITVGATDRDDVKSSFSNWGEQIDMVAPGREIYTVSRTGSLTQRLGTSYAAPQVAGAAALLLSINPDLDQEALAAFLYAGAEDQVGDSQDEEGFDIYYGWGLLNIYNSIVLLKTNPEIESIPGGGIRLSWQAPPNAESKRPYTLDWSTNLVDWSTIETPSISFDSEAEWIDGVSVTGATSGSVERRFYRIGIGMDQGE